MNWPALGILCAAILVHATVVIVLLHCKLSAPPVGLHVAGAIGGYVVLHLGLWAYKCLPAYWLCTCAFAFAAMTYLFAYSAVYKSLSLRVLVRLSAGHPRPLGLDWVTENVIRESFAARARMLASTGMAEHGTNGIRLTPKGLTMATRLDTLRGFFGIRTGGLYFSVPDHTADG